MSLPSSAVAASTPGPAGGWLWSTAILPIAIGIALTVTGGGILSAQPRGGRPAGVTGGPAGEGSSPLWISATPLDDGRQLVLVIDPQLKNAAVYHVDGVSGSLTLRSTRNITWDLLVPEYNAQEPRPATLRKMLDVGAEGVPAGQNRP